MSPAQAVYIKKVALSPAPGADGTSSHHLSLCAPAPALLECPSSSEEEGIRDKGSISDWAYGLSRQPRLATRDPLSSTTRPHSRRTSPKSACEPEPREAARAAAAQCGEPCRSISSGRNSAKRSTTMRERCSRRCVALALHTLESLVDRLRPTGAEQGDQASDHCRQDRSQGTQHGDHRQSRSSFSCKCWKRLFPAADDERIGQPPELEILEIGDLSTDRFRGIFRLTYSGDAYIVLQTRVQVRARLERKVEEESSETQGPSLPFRENRPTRSMCPDLRSTSSTRPASCLPPRRSSSR